MAKATTTNTINKKLLHDIIDRLLIKFPNRLPTKELTSFELGREVGKQDVIKLLIELYEKD